MPSKISTAQMVVYLKALAATGNASLAAAEAGVSRDWAYKKREVDPRFDALFREMKARFRDSPAVPPLHPARAARESPSPSGRGVKRRVQVRRDRTGGWTAAVEERFLAALTVTADVELAASSAGSTAPSAYRRRLRRPGFATGWYEAMESAEAPHALEWFESAECFFERRGVPPDNPVKVTSVDEVLRMLARSERAAPRRGG